MIVLALDFVFIDSIQGKTTDQVIEFATNDSADKPVGTLSPVGIAPRIHFSSLTQSLYIEKSLRQTIILHFDFIFNTTVSNKSLHINFVFGTNDYAAEANIILGMGAQSGIGEPAIKLFHRFVQNVGAKTTSELGQPKLANKNKNFFVAAWRSDIFGTFFIANKIKQIMPSSIASRSSVGVPSVSPRFAYAAGFVSEYFAEPSIYNKNRAIFAFGSSHSTFGLDSTYNHRRYIAAIGKDFQQLSYPYIWLKNHHLEIQSFVGEQWGIPSLQGGLRIVSPKGISPNIIYRFDYYGEPIFGVAYDADSTPHQNTITTQYGRYLSVIAYGMFGSQIIGNHNQSIRPKNLDGTEFGLGLIAPPIRHLYPKSWQSDVYGYVSDTTNGVAKTWNNPNTNMLRLYKGESNWQIGVTVWLSKRGITPTGINAQQANNPILTYRIQTIRPSGISQQYFENPMLNHNQAIKVYSWKSSEEFGQLQCINTKQAHLSVEGFYATNFGVLDFSPRVLVTREFDSQAFGNPLINGGKFQGFSASVFGQHLIGLYVQSIGSKGWSELACGETVVSKALIAPQGFISSPFGDTNAYNKNRIVYPYFIEPNVLSIWTTIHNHHFVIRPPGIINPVIDTQIIENKKQILVLHGFFCTRFGRPSVLYDWQYYRMMQVVGIFATDFGQASVVNKNKHIKTGNISILKLGVPNIKLKLQFVIPSSIVGAFGQAWASLFLRHIITQSKDSLRLGIARISYQTQFVRPPSVKKTQKDFVSNHTVGGTQFISPIGTETTAWLTRIIPTNDVIYPKAIMGELGTPSIDNYHQYISPKGFGNNDGSADTVRFGKLQIFNQTQYIAQYFIPDSGLVPQVFDPSDDNSRSDFGRWVGITNRNKKVATFGVDNSKFGYQQIDNKAVPVLPTPIVGEIGKPMMAYRVRKLPLDGIEAPHFSYWHIIRNNARVIQTKAINNTTFGKPSIASNKQFIKQIFPFENTDIGTPMIADRIRTIDIEWRYSINPPRIPLPTIDNHTRYITPKGFDGTDGFKRKFGRAELNERFNIIKSHGYEHSVFGREVFIKNLTPEVKFFGHNSNEFGDTVVGNQRQDVFIFGYKLNFVMGVPTVRYRTHKVQVGGFKTANFGWHIFERMSAPPYSMQYIELRRLDAKGLEIDGFGVYPPLLSAPSIRTNVLNPIGFRDEYFGRASVVSNGILVDYGIFEMAVGTPAMLQQHKQYLYPIGKPSSNSIGKPQLSPYTIYAPSGDRAAPQARANHHSSGTNTIHMMEFGHTMIANQHRSVQVYYGAYASYVERPSIANKDQVINPKGFRRGAAGFPVIPFVPQAIKQVQSVSDVQIGHHKVIVSKQQIRSSYINTYPLDNQKFGKTAINNFHRAIYPHSFVATQMGQSLYDDTPFMWQGLRVGERVLGNYGGFDSSTFGQAWISNKIREVLLNGLDSFVSETDIRHFKDRLVVKRVGKAVAQSKKTQSIKAVGIESKNLPAPSIKNKVQYIRPDGNSDQFRKGAW